MTAPLETVVENADWAKAKPRLSVLIPFKGDNPVHLLAALDKELADVEVVVLDDGSRNPDLFARVADAVKAMRLPVRFVSLSANEGRSKGRNRLVSHARAPYLLFLDSDMLPDTATFLGAWLSLIETDEPAVAFGGFSLKLVRARPDQMLHERMALKSDCLPAEVRQRQPEKNIFTSNLLVRRDVFETEAFDESFAGWGWEDVEWGMRVARRHPIVHIDNTATHLGLDTAKTIAAKYEQSAANFARVVASHPQVVAAYPSYRVARLLRGAPLRGLWRPLVKGFALADRAPLPARAFAMRLYRAALYADVV
jgi:glycosyltransferase involved in cell wall biosynthesis